MTVDVFKCPFIEECCKSREEETVLYADDREYHYIPPVPCVAPFLEDKFGSAICRLTVDKNKLTHESYRSQIKELKIHKQKVNLSQEMKAAWHRWRET